jgi:hypothetical protein
MSSASTVGLFLVLLCLVISLPVDEGETLLGTDRHFGGIGDGGQTVTR